ncbi:uncharacterized protein LOC108089071 [Drosophila ficusphila]|uniref:uncharacterized protein LOC108089071 n=1 Tax=Drosophila ficusphila TaxID=30025 RepID=UPI0007E70AEB|nr:uncharacterized protein LOC108089071 [Drosophila ficusphila]
MAPYNFISAMEDLALEFTVNKHKHHLFIRDARIVAYAILKQMIQDKTVFCDHVGELHRTAASVDDLNLDLPLNFEIFLPIRLPMAVVPVFDEKRRSVKFTRNNYRHPFLFGNAVNNKSMNLLLQHELQRAISKIKFVSSSCSGRTYDLQYSVLICNQVPFVHKVVAVERGTNRERFIRYDFVLALEFHNAVMTLPPYFKAPLSQRWIAYGMVDGEGDSNPAEWAVLVPKWQDLKAGARLVAVNCQILLFRLLTAQQCSIFALPASIKFAFVMAAEKRGEQIQNISIADLTITELFHQVFCNLKETVPRNTRGDEATRTSRLMAIRKQQLRARAVYALLADAALRNCVTARFLHAYFWFICLTPPPESFHQSLVEVHSTESPLKS